MPGQFISNTDPKPTELSILNLHSVVNELVELVMSRGASSFIIIVGCACQHLQLPEWFDGLRLGQVIQGGSEPGEL